MLLYLTAYNEPIKKRKNVEYTSDITSYYLIYIDKGYNGNGSPLSIDKFSVTRDPFADNWCVWAEDKPLG